MSTRSHVMWVVLLVLVVCGTMAQAQVPPLLNYQGRVALNGTNFNGTGQFKFALGNSDLSVVYWHNASAWDSMDWEPVTAVSLTVTRGLFSVLLGDTNLSNMAALSPTVFTNSQVWLRTWFDDGVSGAQKLTPDQRIVSAGYAMQAESVSLGAITTDMLDDDAVTGAKIADATITFANIAQGGASAGQALVWNGTAWSNAAPSAGLSGYDENGPFSPAPVAGGSGAIAMGAGANAAGDYSVVGGGLDNTNKSTATYSVIAGGNSNCANGMWQVIGGGGGNKLSGQFGGGNYNAIGGGKNNEIAGGDYSWAAVIAGGLDNYIAGVGAPVIGGGEGNRNSGGHATVAGGYSNQIILAARATIGGGHGNAISNLAHNATIGGGQNNFVGLYASNAVIAGGAQNTIGDDAIGAAIGGGVGCTAEGDYSVVGGGLNNTNQADYAVVGGGQGNRILGSMYVGLGHHTIGGGSSNQVLNEGGPGCAYGTIGGGRYNRAGSNWCGVIGGGYSNHVERYCSTIPGGWANMAHGDYSFAAGSRAHAWHSGSFVWGDTTSGDVESTNDNSWTVRCYGGARFFTGSGVGPIVGAGSGTWGSMSDRNVKDSFEEVNPREVLEKVASLPVTTWRYKTQDPSIRHIGPVAQDFYAAFGVGESDRYIPSSDADGVALAAIKALYQENQELKARLAEVERKMEEMGR